MRKTIAMFSCLVCLLALGIARAQQLDCPVVAAGGSIGSNGNFHVLGQFAAQLDVGSGVLDEGAIRCWIGATAFPNGDMNCDGVLDLLDVDAFVLALIDPDSYAIQYPACDVGQGDLNTDSSTDGDDVPLFAMALIH